MVGALLVWRAAGVRPLARGEPEDVQQSGEVVGTERTGGHDPDGTGSLFRGQALTGGRWLLDHEFSSDEDSVVTTTLLRKGLPEAEDKGPPMVT